MVYCGCDAAWCGYGGGFVYTRTAECPKRLEDHLAMVAAEAGVDWKAFVPTDNAGCGDAVVWGGAGVEPGGGAGDRWWSRSGGRAEGEAVGPEWREGGLDVLVPHQSVLVKEGGPPGGEHGGSSESPSSGGEVVPGRGTRGGFMALQ